MTQKNKPVRILIPRPVTPVGVKVTRRFEELYAGAEVDAVPVIDKGIVVSYQISWKDYAEAIARNSQTASCWFQRRTASFFRLLDKKNPGAPCSTFIPADRCRLVVAG